MIVLPNVDPCIVSVVSESEMAAYNVIADGRENGIEIVTFGEQTDQPKLCWSYIKIGKLNQFIYRLIYNCYLI